MKIVIAQLKHETNTFSPVPTGLARFTRIGDEPPCGDAAVREYKNTGSAIAAMIDLAEQAGAEYRVPVAGNAPPSGPVQNEAYEWMVSRICEAVREGCDAVLLDLHGAMVTETYEDGEGELLKRLRQIAPTIPIGVALDMHTNLSNTMVTHADVLAGYQTYPHVDVYETGIRAAKPIIDWLKQKHLLRQQPANVSPLHVAYKAWGQVPMLPHVMRQSSLDSPNREIQARCKAIEAEGALAASVFVGFPHADIPIAGMSAMVIDPSDQARADRWRDELLHMCWQAREAFVYHIEALDESIARAKKLANTAVEGKPVVLLDHYDNCASGGTMDTMAVLDAMIRADLQNAAAFAICDPQAVQTLMKVGVGGEASLMLGGKHALSSLKRPGEPLKVSGRVKTLTDGQYRFRGPMARGERANMGAAAVLQVGGIEIAVISRHVEPFDINTLITLGIDPYSKKFLMLKSRVHWRAGLGELAGAVVECAGVGVCTSDYDSLSFHKVRRPIYPLDPVTSFQQGQVIQGG